jgi:hypothetical protein
MPAVNDPTAPGTDRHRKHAFSKNPRGTGRAITDSSSMLLGMRGFPEPLGFGKIQIPRASISELPVIRQRWAPIRPASFKGMWAV